MACRMDVHLTETPDFARRNLNQLGDYTIRGMAQGHSRCKINEKIFKIQLSRAKVEGFCSEGIAD